MLNLSAHFWSWLPARSNFYFRRFWLLSKFNFLITIFQINISRLLCIIIVSFFINIFHHILWNTLWNSQWVNFFGCFVFDVWDEERAFNLLLVKLFWINTSMISQVIVKLWLSWNLSLVNFFGPKWMLSQMLPVNTLDRIFLEKTLQEIIEKWRKFINLWRFFFTNLCDQVFETSGGKWRLSSCQLIEHTTQCPHVRIKTVNTIIWEKFWGHIIWRSALGLWLVSLLLFVQIIQLFWKAKIAELQSIILIHEHIWWLEVCVNNIVGV